MPQLFTRQLIAGLICLTTLVEHVPALHGHEEPHPCVYLDGSYFHLAPSDEDFPAGTQVRGLSLGEIHQHHECGFCHARTVALPVQVEVYFTQHSSEIGLLDKCFNIHNYFNAVHSRGPPISPRFLSHWRFI